MIIVSYHTMWCHMIPHSTTWYGSLWYQLLQLVLVGSYCCSRIIPYSNLYQLVQIAVVLCGTTCVVCKSPMEHSHMVLGNRALGDRGTNHMRIL